MRDAMGREKAKPNPPPRSAPTPGISAKKTAHDGPLGCVLRGIGTATHRLGYIILETEDDVKQLGGGPLALLLIATLAKAETTPIPAPEDVAAAPSDALTTASGLASKVIEAGAGKEHPGRTAIVKVNYTGWTTDGKMFDSSLTTGKPATFPLDKVIAGWTEGVQLMVAGETRRFWIPESLAYHGAAGKPAGTLVFEVKLISFDRPPTEAPPDLKSPPPEARKTISGLHYLVLRPGSGKHPSASSKVTVITRVGRWTESYSSTARSKRGTPATFALRGGKEGGRVRRVGGKLPFYVGRKASTVGGCGRVGLVMGWFELGLGCLGGGVWRGGRRGGEGGGGHAAPHQGRKGGQLLSGFPGGEAGAAATVT